MSGPHARRMWIGVCVILAVAWPVSWAVVGERYGPKLAASTQDQRLQKIRSLSNGDSDGSARTAIALVREYLLDFPDAHATDLRVKLALRMAATPGADLGAADAELDKAARSVLDFLPPVLDPNRKQLEDAGFEFLAGRYGWPIPFVVTDIDGDGLNDLIFATPGGANSYCYLFRRTATGWERHLFGVGLNVIGVQVFDISKRGPKAVVVSSMLSQEYNPNVQVDVFVWRDGGLRSVLPSVMHAGWQWDHKDLNGDGVEELRIYASPEDAQVNGQHAAAPAKYQAYRWTGSEFVPLTGKVDQTIAVTPTAPLKLEQGAPPASEDYAVELSRVERQIFEDRKFDEAGRSLHDFELRVRSAPLGEIDKNDLLRETYYHEAICLRKLGRNRDAALVLRGIWNSTENSRWGEMAEAWLDIDTLLKY